MIGFLDQPEKRTAYQAVLRAEIEHLKRGMGVQRSPLRWGFIWILVLMALIAFGWRVINTIPQQPSLLNWLLFKLNFDVTNFYLQGGLNDTFFPIMLLFPLGVVMWDFWLMFQTLGMSANSIARERHGKSWELLLLTGMTTQQIVIAKWWAVVRQQWTDYALLAIMRIGAVSFLAMSFSVDFYLGRPPYFSYGRTGPKFFEPHIATVFGMAVSIVLLSTAFIAVLTMLNLMFTAACGIAGGTITPRPSLALSFGIVVRLVLVTIVAILFGVPGYVGLKPDIDGFYNIDPVLSTSFLILSLIGATIVDNGSIAAGLLMRFGYDFRWKSTFDGFSFFSITLRGHGPAFLTALLLSIVIYAILTYLLLQRAEKIIARQSIA